MLALIIGLHASIFAQATPKAMPRPCEVTVTMGPEGRLSIGPTSTTLANLPADLDRAIGGKAPRTRAVCVKAAADVRYSDLIEVFDRLQDAGYRASIALINGQP